ncbi:MAG: hypothetical protein ABSE70_09480 [Candidatus Limnocylindrales bacterium]
MTDEGAPRGPRSDHGFAHASEGEFARILDFYQVAWEYEPQVFPILWDLDGNVLESFAPDFFLPELELFVELTTLQQRLVRKKNRKVRRLRELYPGLRIKLFYARDFRALMLKYGRAALVSELSGTPGQVIPHEQGHEPSAPAGFEDGSDGTGRLLIDRSDAGSDPPGELGRPPARHSRAARRRAGRRASAGAAPHSPVT